MKAGRKKETETAAESFYGFAKFLAHLILSLYLLLILVVMPYYFTDGFSHIGTDKFTFFKRWSLNAGKLLLPVLIACLLLSCVVRLQKRGKKTVGISATDCFALWYGAGLLLSFGCSPYRAQAKWGAQGWYMGLYTQLILLAVYFLLSRLWRCGKAIPVAALAASAGVFALGVLNRFGIFPLHMGDMAKYDVLYISTVGNINWFCGYLVCLLFFGLALYWQGAVRKRGPVVLLTAYLFLGFCALIVQGSASGYLALAAVFLLCYCLSGKDADRMRRFWETVFLFSAAAAFLFALRKVFPGRLLYTDRIMDLATATALPFLMLALTAFLSGRMKKGGCGRYLGSAGLVLTSAAVLLFLYAALLIFHTLRPEVFTFLPRGIFTFDDEWGSKRGITWTAGALCFQEQDWLHKLVGVGPDSMYMQLYFSGNEALVARLQENFGAALLTNAHCEWLTVLVNTGIVGLIGYAGMMLSAAFRFIKAGRENRPLACACGVAVSAYVCNNIFSFQQTMSAAVIFCILGMGEAYMRQGRGGA